MEAKGRKLKLLLTRGMKIARRFDALKTKKVEIEAEIAALIAEMKDREATDAITLTLGTECLDRLEVSWSKKYVVDPKQVALLKSKIPAAEFAKLFTEKVVYSRARSQGPWLKQAQGKLDRWKDRIMGTTKEVFAKTPAFKWLYQDDAEV